MKLYLEEKNKHYLYHTRQSYLKVCLLVSESDFDSENGLEDIKENVREV